MSARTMEATTSGLHALTKREIDRRIEMVVTHVALFPVDDESTGGDDLPDLRPRWISAAELVRRMQPFLCQN